MAGKAGFVPIWMKHAEEQKNKEEQQNAATARAAFDATFRDFDSAPDSGNNISNSSAVLAIEGLKGGSRGYGNASDMESDDDNDSEGEAAEKPIGPLDPSKCTAAGAGVSGGGAGAIVSLVVTARDCDGRRVPAGGASVRVRISPSSGGGEHQEAAVKDGHDGTYTATYAVARRGDYTVTVECDGRPILGSPFPVFFGGGAVANGTLPGASFAQGSAAPSMNGGGSSNSIVSSMFPGLLGMIPGMLAGATGGVILPGMAASFGEICRDYLNGCCAKSDCKYNHPPQNQLMAALAGGTILGGLTLAPMAPSAAAMAAAQSIVAAQAYQANVSAQQHDKSGNAPPLPVMMQQAIASQQLQFQQSLFMQQAFISQQAAVRTATVKSATEMATARAAEISKKLKGNDGNDDNDGKETDTETAVAAATAAAAASVSAAGVGAAAGAGTGTGSGSGRRQRLKSSPQPDGRSKSRSPIKYHRDRHSRSASRSPGRYRQGRHLRPMGRDNYRQRSPIRDVFTRRNSHFFMNRGRERERARGYHLQRSRRSRSRSRSRSRRKAASVSPRHRRDRNHSPRSSRRDEKRSSQRHSRRSRSTSKEPKQSAVLVTDNAERSKSGKVSKETHYHEDAKLVSDQGLDDDRSKSRKRQSNRRHGVSKRSGEKERQSSEQIIVKARHSPESPEIVSSGVRSKDHHDGMERKINEGDMQEGMLELDDW